MRTVGRRRSPSAWTKLNLRCRVFARGARITSLLSLFIFLSLQFFCSPWCYGLPRRWFTWRREGGEGLPGRWSVKFCPGIYPTSLNPTDICYAWTPSCRRVGRSVGAAPLFWWPVWTGCTVITVHGELLLIESSCRRRLVFLIFPIHFDVCFNCVTI